MIRRRGVRKIDPERMTVIRVDHSERNAAHSDRVIHLMDGWMNNGEEPALPARNAAAGKRGKNHSEAT